MATIHSIELIVSDPKIRKGKPVMTGTTIRVMDIATVKVFHQKEADEIADWFDISLPEVYAALSYYYTHKVEVDQDIRNEQQLAEQFKEQRVGSRHSALLG